jgi:hypothetical protein
MRFYLLFFMFVCFIDPIEASFESFLILQLLVCACGGIQIWLASFFTLFVMHYCSFFFCPLIFTTNFAQKENNSIL